MPMVYPNEGPGMGSAALDALRGLGLHDAADNGSMQKMNKHRLTEGNNWGGSQEQTAENPLALQILQMLQQKQQPMP